MPGTETPKRSAPHHVVIVGGGVAAIEALLALNTLAGRRVRITLIAPEDSFLYRPVTVGEAFDRSEARRFPLREIVGEHSGDTFRQATVTRVDAEDRVVITDRGDPVWYDSLLLAPGARTTEPLTGALTFRGRDDVEALRALLAELARRPARTVAFAIPSERTWPVPIYELALMTAAQLRQHGPLRGRVQLVTPEAEPLALFGPEASRAVEPILRARGIVLRTMCRPTAVARRSLRLAGGGSVPADRVVTLPVPVGPNLPGIARDEEGFIPVDAYCRVVGHDGVYAAGDATSFPLKQGGLATQQADVVARSIAASVGANVKAEPFRPILRGLLMTGGAPLYLRAEPQRLPRPTSVAIEAGRVRGLRSDASAAAGQPLWWPPTKIAGRYLSAYLAGARSVLEPEELADRAPVHGARADAGEFDDALELSLLLADCDAQWGDYPSALSALDAAEALQGSLSPEYEAKRRAWRGSLAAR